MKVKEKMKRAADAYDKAREYLLRKHIQHASSYLQHVQNHLMKFGSYFGDPNEDGNIEVTAIDQNEDGNFEIILFDTNGNGNPDEAEVDKNEDGIAEYIAYDLDEDGTWDKFEKI